MNKDQEHITYTFSQKKVACYFNSGVEELSKLLPDQRIIWLVDGNVHGLHQEQFTNKEVLIIPSGEKHKNQETVNRLINQLIEKRADRTSFLVGVGGGVATDITGFVASIYMRGLRFALMPTTILAMVDACIGGKNGIDVGVYKNMVGVINQPEILAYDFDLLSTLPNDEWKSGFAEIVKHACIRDADLFADLELRTLKDYQSNKQMISDLVLRNVDIKSGIVAGDEREAGDRRLLNFGHTFGHAIENIYKIPHGFAVSIGIVLACEISTQLNNFSEDGTKRISGLLKRFELPVVLDFDKTKIWNVMTHDKKLSGNDIHFITLQAIGKGAVKKIPLTDLKNIFFKLQ